MLKYVRLDVTPKYSDIISKGDKRPVLDTEEKYSTYSGSERTDDFMRVVREIFFSYGIPVPVTFEYRDAEGMYTIGTLNRARTTGQIQAGKLIPIKSGNNIIGVIPADAG